MRKITLEQVKNLWRSRDYVNNKFCDWELQEEYPKTFVYIYFYFELEKGDHIPAGWPDFFENRKVGVKLWEVDDDFVEEEDDDDYRKFWTKLENRMELTDPGDEDNKEWDLLEAVEQINKVLEDYYDRYDEEYEPTEEFARAMEGIYE